MKNIRAFGAAKVIDERARDPCCVVLFTLGERHHPPHWPGVWLVCIWRPYIYAESYCLVDHRAVVDNQSWDAPESGMSI